MNLNLMHILKKTPTTINISIYKKQVIQMDEIKKLEYDDEIKANRISTIILAVIFGICLIIWIANEIGIFVVNLAYMRVGMAVSFICMSVPIIIFSHTKGDKNWFKYLLIIFLSLTSVSIETFLTFHGVMLCVFPVLLAAQYPNIRVFRLAYWFNLFGILFSVIVGYYIGCWDGNMIYATTFGMTQQNDSLAARISAMNTTYMAQLILYFALPRMVIFSTISLGISYIVKTVKLQYVRQSMIRMEAEYDSLTKLENRTKYNSRVSGENEKLESICIVFLDVNNLKKMNDTYGHEAGDFVLKRTAEEMKKLICDTIHGYRLGGDEFVMILCNYKKEEADALLTKWKESLTPLNGEEYDVQCSLAIGVTYASRPFDIDSVLKKADDKMYQTKIAMKANRIN